jgi:uncharacterized ferritin-like protein (DUF455 family)
VGGAALTLPERLAACLRVSEPAAKLACVQALQADWLAGRVDPAADMPREPIDQPGRPPRPELVPPQRMPRRRADTPPAAPR